MGLFLKKKRKNGSFFCDGLCEKSFERCFFYPTAENFSIWAFCLLFFFFRFVLFSPPFTPPQHTHKQLPPRPLDMEDTTVANQSVSQNPFAGMDWLDKPDEDEETYYQLFATSMAVSVNFFDLCDEDELVFFLSLSLFSTARTHFLKKNRRMVFQGMINHRFCLKKHQHHQRHHRQRHHQDHYLLLPLSLLHHHPRHH